MKPSIHIQLGELDNKKLLLLFLKKITQTKPCIDMIQLLLYQINWPAILELESVGTGPSSHAIPPPFRGIFSFFYQVCSKF